MSERIKSAFDVMHKLICKDNCQEAEIMADELMLTTVQRLMRVHMVNARENDGRYGWWLQKRCTKRDLQELLIKCINNEDWIDAANYAGMLFMKHHMDSTDEE